MKASVDWLTAILLFYPGSLIATLYGGQVKTLGLPMSSFAVTCQVWMAVCFLLVPVLFWGTKWDWMGRVVAPILGIACLAVPWVILEWGAVAIPLQNDLTSQQKETMNASFTFPKIVCAYSGKGNHMRMRRSDYSPEVEQRLREIGALREGDAAEANAR
ncbi:MAG: hypothetical protein ACAI34_03050 [Verrucomicrobium sp.]